MSPSGRVKPHPRDGNLARAIKLGGHPTSWLGFLEFWRAEKENPRLLDTLPNRRNRAKS
jgi:hypothetical protein